MAACLRAFLRTLTLLTLVLSLVTCETHGTAAGGGSDSGGGGRIKLDWPF
ncbi:MAG TPA: hypothetical protein VGL83_14520 [Stellaceae bacterium]|jgi:hypothetical protein